MNEFMKSRGTYLWHDPPSTIASPNGFCSPVVAIDPQCLSRIRPMIWSAAFFKCFFLLQELAYWHVESAFHQSTAIGTIFFLLFRCVLGCLPLPDRPSHSCSRCQNIWTGRQTDRQTDRHTADRHTHAHTHTHTQIHIHTHTYTH